MLTKDFSKRLKVLPGSEFCAQASSRGPLYFLSKYGFSILYCCGLILPLRPERWISLGGVKMCLSILWMTGCIVFCTFVVVRRMVFELASVRIESDEFLAQMSVVFNLALWIGGLLVQYCVVRKARKLLLELDTFTWSYTSKRERILEFGVVIALGVTVLADLGLEIWSFVLYLPPFYRPFVSPLVKEESWLNVIVGLALLTNGTLPTVSTRVMNFVLSLVPWILGHSFREQNYAFDIISTVSDPLVRRTVVQDALNNRDELSRQVRDLSSVLSGYVAVQFANDFLCLVVPFYDLAAGTPLTFRPYLARFGLGAVFAVLRCAAMVFMADQASAEDHRDHSARTVLFSTYKASSVSVPLRTLQEMEPDPNFAEIIRRHYSYVTATPCSFTAAEAFEINRPFVGTVVGALVTYLVFIFQLGKGLGKDKQSLAMLNGTFRC